MTDRPLQHRAGVGEELGALLKRAATVSGLRGGEPVIIKHSDHTYHVRRGEGAATVRDTTRTELHIGNGRRWRERLSQEDRQANTKFAQELLDSE